MERLVNASPLVDVWYRHVGSTIEFDFVLDGMVHGAAEFEVAPLLTQKLPFKTPRRPHIQLSAELAGRGIATQLYKIALDRGISLITPSHSTSAARLWDRLASYPGVNSYWFSKSGRELSGPSPKALRVLTKETLLKLEAKQRLLAAGKYDHIDFTPPKGAQEAAKRALEVRKEKPESQRGMTPVGIARARDLSNGKTLSPETVRRMLSYFSRHEVDKKGSSWSEKGAGWQAWMGWGGDAGYSWAKKVVNQMDKADAK